MKGRQRRVAVLGFVFLFSGCAGLGGKKSQEASHIRALLESNVGIDAKAWRSRERPGLAIVPLRHPERSKNLGQASAHWIAAHMTRSGWAQIYPPSKVRGVLRRAGFHAENLSHQELAAALRALLPISALVEGEVIQSGSRRQVKCWIWNLEQMEQAPLLTLESKGSFAAFEKMVISQLHLRFPIEAEVDIRAESNTKAEVDIRAEVDIGKESQGISVKMGSRQGLRLGDLLVLYRTSRVYRARVILADLRVTAVSQRTCMASVESWRAGGIDPWVMQGDVARLVR